MGLKALCHSSIALYFQFSGNRGFQLLVVIHDSDIDTDDLIDRVVVDRVLEVSNSFTSPQNYGGQYNRASLKMSFRVMCNTNYYGRHCNVSCTSRDDASGHYGCDSNGNRFCLDGWTDLANDCTERELCWSMCFDGCHATRCLPEQCVERWH